MYCPIIHEMAYSRFHLGWFFIWGAVRTVTKQNGNNQNGYTNFRLAQNGNTLMLLGGGLVKTVT